MGEALVDLANICCDGDCSDAQWGRYLAVKESWKRSGGGRVRAIGDASLRRFLFGADLAHLERAQRSGEVELVPFADPHLIRRVLATPGLSLISNDQFRDHLVEFPEFAGFDRIFGVHWPEDGAAELVRFKIDHQEPAEASRHAEKAMVRHLGFRRGTADFELLRWDWHCTSIDCDLAVLPQLDELPHCDNGVAVCPLCDEVLERLSKADGGVELKLAVAGIVTERFSLADGAGLVLGRGAEAGHFDVSHVLGAVS